MVLTRSHTLVLTPTRTQPASPAFWAAVTLWRPSNPASHHRRGRSWVDCKGSDHAYGTPAACLVAGRIDLEALPEGARQRNCEQRVAVPDGGSCTIACPAPRRTPLYRVLWRVCEWGLERKCSP